MTIISPTNNLEHMREIVVLRIREAREIIIQDHPFFSTALLKTPWEVSATEQTASYGRGKIRYGIKFTFGLTLEQVIGLTLHELFHKILLHSTRRLPDWDPYAFNLAADCVVNYLLALRGVELPPGGTEDAPHLRDFLERTREYSVEETYAALIREGLTHDPPDEPDDPPSDDEPEEGEEGREGDEEGEEGDEEGEGGKGEGDGEGDGKGPVKKRKSKQEDDEGDDDEATSKGEDEGDGDDDGKEESDDGEGEEDGDDGEGDEEGEEEGDDAGSDGDNNGKPRPWGWVEDETDEDGNKLSDSELEEIKQSSSELIKEGEKAERSRGKTGSGGEAAKAALGEVLHPPLTWDQILREFLYGSVGEPAYNWNRVDRRFVHVQGTPEEILAPQRTNEGLDVLVLGVDCSGSVYPSEFQVFNARISEIIDELQPRETHVIYCSHVINSIDVFQSGDVVELREQAGGGTWFKPVFDYVRRELNNECSGLVYFTDLECPHDYDISAITYPVLWASTCPTNEYNTPPVGEVLVVIPD